ncbi:aminoacyl-tRNA hydrolase [Candidatus Venteria ishoeyi]|uniref:Peptidyl-tRNA hydrolase n=1 Tax=Candidatus Venteria ishoeyi TaxID=1899563 RepID=A0A1H6F4Q4_9GAMM|nr:aminoacyl-tRNA hydrolase [Candidatus Venteria ishoeyi]MDM8547567.1 aminoacyl-tRNA hydrolase [Candidatus Venteria ishoeyi]SEH04543.1 Peptidyl-tRNA hydrolase [Candidatus Venteria ishoeyi]
MESSILAIAGLGNPGSRYQDTRHNAGFWFLDALLKAEGGGAFRPEKKVHGQLTKTTSGIWLLKPDTYMNHSGRSVAALLRFYRIPPERLLVVHDDLDLDSGIAKLKRSGGHGGHNGLRDIIAQLGSKDFKRLRLGVGHPGQRQQVVDHVLKRPSLSESRDIEHAIERSLQVMDKVLKGEFDAAMNQLH